MNRKESELETDELESNELETEILFNSMQNGSSTLNKTS